jgi:hypothetical protein
MVLMTKGCWELGSDLDRTFDRLMARGCVARKRGPEGLGYSVYVLIHRVYARLAPMIETTRQPFHLILFRTGDRGYGMCGHNLGIN